MRKEERKREKRRKISKKNFNHKQNNSLFFPFRFFQFNNRLLTRGSTTFFNHSWNRSWISSMVAAFSFPMAQTPPRPRLPYSFKISLHIYISFTLPLLGLEEFPIWMDTIFISRFNVLAKSEVKDCSDVNAERNRERNVELVDKGILKVLHWDNQRKSRVTWNKHKKIMRSLFHFFN